MLLMQIQARRQIADGIVFFELAPADPRVHLPPFDAGAHIKVRTPSGLEREYSLCNPPEERSTYQVAVKCEMSGRGGSRSMVEQLEAGQLIEVAEPQNYFPLDDAAADVILIAGGIGITPIRAMALELAGKGKPFQLIYCTRSPETTAFRADLNDRENVFPYLTIHHDQGDPGRLFDFSSLLRAPRAGAHVYCCGPSPLMHRVRDLTRHWPAGCVHFEDFAATLPESVEGDTEFAVRLNRQGVTLPIPKGATILQVLRGSGYAVSSSCESGTCGSCRTRVLGGTPDHRCYLLDEDDTSEIMVCVSRSKSPELILDI